MPDTREREAIAAIEEGAEFLAEARALEKAGFPGPSLRSAYYAMYHSALALLHLEDTEPRTHRGVINEFTRLFVKGGSFPEEMAGDLSRVLAERLKNDYETGLSTSEETAHWALERAEAFVAEVREALAGKIGS